MDYQKLKSEIDDHIFRLRLQIAKDTERIACLEAELARYRDRPVVAWRFEYNDGSGWFYLDNRWSDVPINAQALVLKEAE